MSSNARSYVNSVKLIVATAILIAVASLDSSARADIVICNGSSFDFYVAIASKGKDHWRSAGFHEVEKNACSKYLGSYEHQFYYTHFMFRDTDGQLYRFEYRAEDSKQFCILNAPDGFPPFNLPFSHDCGSMTFGELAGFLSVDSGPKGNCKLNLADRDDTGKPFLYTSCPVEIQRTQIYDRCLISWDDSQQVHSSELIINWDYQAWKTVLKRLHHCIRLRAVGPIQVEGAVCKRLRKQGTQFA
jgi:uncharacterized membrane protein